MSSSTQTLTDLAELYLLRCDVEGKSPRTVQAYRWTLVAVHARARRRRCADECRGHRVRPHLRLPRSLHPAQHSRPDIATSARCAASSTGWWKLSISSAARSGACATCACPSASCSRSRRSKCSSCWRPAADGAMASRDRALLLVLLDTGARCSEVVQLRTCRPRPRGRPAPHPACEGKQAAGRALRRTLCAGPVRLYRGARVRARAIVSRLERASRLDVRRRLAPNGLKQMLRRLGRRSGIAKVHAHRFRHTFATWAIQHDARELDVQYLLGHVSPDMVRRYSSWYRSEQAALRHDRFSPADQMLAEPGRGRSAGRALSRHPGHSRTGRQDDVQPACSGFRARGDYARAVRLAA